jgi:hypothetical protein
VQLPNFYQAAADEFREEWATAIKVFGHTLSRRLAIEQALGEPLDLLPPMPASEQPDLGELAAPGETVRTLHAAIAQIEASHAQELRERARQVPSFDNEAVYEFIRPANINGRTYSPGERVVGSLLGEAGFRYCVSSRLLRRVDLVHA